MGVMKEFQEVDPSVMIVAGERKFQEDTDLLLKRDFDGAFNVKADRNGNFYMHVSVETKTKVNALKFENE